MKVTTKLTAASTLSVVPAAFGHRLMTLVMTPRTYEITFAGEAVPAIVCAFEGFEVNVGVGITTLRAQLRDQAALHGTLDRLMALGLDLLEVKAVDAQPFE
jgi:hypothetical protein